MVLGVLPWVAATLLAMIGLVNYFSNTYLEYKKSAKNLIFTLFILFTITVALIIIVAYLDSSLISPTGRAVAVIRGN